jgi:HlyD family secretion protein
LHPFRSPIAVVCAALLGLAAACSRKSGPSLRSEPVTRGSLSEIVSATGGVEAIVTINIGSQVSGTIDQLKVDFNSQVKKGQLLARIDPRPFAAQLAKSDAGVASADAGVVKAEAAFADAERIDKRTRELFQRGLVSQADIDTSAANRDQANAALVAAKAMVKQAKADRQQAALNLEFTKIVSPIDGIVISRSIDVGQTVAAAFQAPQLFSIANDLTKMRVLANVDEADVGKVKGGQEVHFTVDSFPGMDFKGTISQVRHAPTTVNNVVTYAAEIDAPNPKLRLRQGMTAAVQVITAKRENALRVPNAALRWKPDDAPAGAGPGAPGGGRPAGGGPQASGGARAAERTPGQQEHGQRNEVLDRPVGVKGEGGKGEGGDSDRRTRKARVYKLVQGRPVAVAVRVGVSDGHQTEVLDGLSENDEVVVGGSFTLGTGGGQRQGGPRRGLF